MIEYRGQALLVGLEMERESLELSSSLRIRQIDEEQEESFYRYYVSPRRMNKDELYVIENEYEVDKFGDNRVEEALESFDDVILALRLFDEPGDIWYVEPRSRPLSPFHQTENRGSSQNPMNVYNDSMNISEERSDDFSEFWDEMHGWLNDPPEVYRIALDKFSTSVSRENQSDRLLDSVIALEAMYLKSSEAQ